MASNTFSCSGGCSASTAINLLTHVTNTYVTGYKFYSGLSLQVNDLGTGDVIWNPIPSAGVDSNVSTTKTSNYTAAILYMATRCSH